MATDYYSAFGLASQVAAGYARGVQRGQTPALVGEAPHPTGLPEGRLATMTSPLKNIFAHRKVHMAKEGVAFGVCTILLGYKYQ